MTQSDAERRAYMRGYNRGRKSVWSAYSKIIEISKAWRTKAAEGYFGGARCDTCANWKRSGQAKWGKCSQDWESAPSLGTAWADSEDFHETYLASHENFACVNWHPGKKPSPKNER